MDVSRKSIVLAMVEDRKLQNEFALHLEDLKGDERKRKRHVMFQSGRLCLFTWFSLRILKPTR